MNYKVYAFFLFSTIFAFPAGAQTFTDPLYDIGFGQTLNLDNMGTSSINFQEVTQTITVNGTNFTYTTLQKTNPALDWVITSGGITGYTRYDELSLTTEYLYGGVISNFGTVNINSVVFKDNINSGTYVIEGPIFYHRYVYGGVIYNAASGEVGPLIAEFINNGVIADSPMWAVVFAYGGAIHNAGTIGNITGNFINNYTTSTSLFLGNASGGAIYNEGDIGNITGNFIDNYASASGNEASTAGGAISNSGSIGNITGSFINNYVTSNHSSLMHSGARGGAIINWGSFGNITGDFINNYASSSLHNDTSGGAIANFGSFGNISGNFVNNYASTSFMFAYGGAISNTDTIGNINGSFINNYVSASAFAYGGAIYNSYSLGDISSNFINNYAQAFGPSSVALGGAIYTNAPMTFKADGTDNFFTGNYTQDLTRGKIYNAIFANAQYVDYDPETYESIYEIGNLTFDVTNNANFIIDDNIETGLNNWDGTIDYSTHGSLTITGDGTGKVFMRNDLVNIGEVTINDTMLIFAQGPYGKGRFIPDGSLITPMSGNNSVTSLSMTNGQFYIYNNYFDTVNLVNYTVAGTSFLHIEVGKDGGVWTSDLLNISGNINGQTHVIVYALTPDTDLTSVVFVDAPNDVIENREAFRVFRTYGSPFIWEAHRNINGNETGSVWYLTQTNEDNPFPFLPDPIEPSSPPELPGQPGPDPDPEIEVNPEIMAYRGLQIAALEQTRSMVYNVRNKVAANKILPNPCANVVDEYMGKNIWVNPIYFNSTTKRPVEIDANIWGLEAGFDVQRDINHKLGIFVSYRKGDYDLNGKGTQYYSTIGSTIDIDSYIAGLYYRYDYRHLWAFATLYGGIQQADIKTKDGVKADTDGKQVGGSAEVGYTYALKQDLNLEPSLGVFYTQIDFDNINDTFGKTAKYGTINQIELEAGVKLEQQIGLDNGMAKIYVKPSVVRLITNGDNVTITGLGRINTYDDRTLGRMEIGGRYAITNQLSTYGFANYTFGSNYDATSLGIGLNYAW